MLRPTSKFGDGALAMALAGLGVKDVVARSLPSFDRSDVAIGRRVATLTAGLGHAHDAYDDPRGTAA